MLTQERRGSCDFTRGLRKFYRDSCHLDLPRLGVGKLYHHLPVEHLGIGEEFVEGVDGSCRYARILEQLEPLSPGLGLDYLAQDSNQLLPVLNPLGAVLVSKPAGSQRYARRDRLDAESISG